MIMKHEINVPKFQFKHCTIISIPKIVFVDDDFEEETESDDIVDE